MKFDTNPPETIDRPPVRKSNPYQLTNRQHIFPAKSIERFTNKGGFVELNWFASAQAIRPAKPNDGAFFVKKGWTHGAEQQQTKVETQFQITAERILKSGVTLRCEDSGISEFFALWRSRVRFRHSPLPDTELSSLPGDELSLDQREILERKGVLYSVARGEGGARSAFAEGRQMTGPLIRVEMDRQLREMRGVEWRLVTAAAGEFVVPDTFGDFLAVPLTPTQMLVAGHEGVVPVEWVRSTNMQAIMSARSYWFAHAIRTVLYP